MKRNKNTAGFTLVELIVVIAILGILAGVGTVGYSGYIKSAHKNLDKATIQEVVRAVDTAGKTYAYDIVEVGQASADGLQIPIGFVMLTNGVKTDGTTGDYVKVMSTDDEIGVANSAMLEKVLSDAFGSNYAAELKLQSDVWTESTIPGMFAEADSLYSSMQGLTNVLAGAANNRWTSGLIASKFPNIGNYKDESGNVVGEKVVVGMAEGVASISQDTMLAQWMNVEGNGGINCAFGLNTKGVETYTAARRAYNEGFAAYINSRTDVTHTKTAMENKGSFLSPDYQVVDKGPASASTHANQISSYGFGIDGSDLIVSDSICGAAFTSDAIQTSAISGSGSLNDDVQHCETCQSLYNEYKNSEQCRQNGIAFYQAMVTIADTQEDAFENEDGFWGYYNGYIENFSGLYDAVDAERTQYESAVVLTVYQKNGLMVPEVSPNNYLDA